MQRHRRSLKNYLLMPTHQLRLGLYTVFLTMLFSVSVLVISLVAFERLYLIVLDLIPRVTELRIFINTYMWETVGWLSLSGVLYVLANVILMVIATHRWIGPSVAFRRHIDALKTGDYTARVCLRKGDAFQELADELNDLSAVLQSKHGDLAEP